MAIDIQKVINDKVTEMLNEGAITEAIEKAIESSVIKCIKDSMDSWEVTGKIRDKMKKELSEQLDVVSFAGYTKHVIDTVLDLVEKEKTSDIRDKVLDSYKSIFIPNNKRYTINDLVSAFQDYLNGSFDYDEKMELEGRYYAEIKEDSRGCYKLILAESEDVAKRKHSSRYDDSAYYEICLHKGYQCKDGEYKVYIIFDSVGVFTKRFDRAHYNEFEKLLLNIYLNENIIDAKDLSPDDCGELDCYADVDC